MQRARRRVQRQGDRPGLRSEVGATDLDAAPAHIRLGQDVDEAAVADIAQQRCDLAACRHESTRELEQVCVSLDERPVEPGRLVVVAVGVVVATLGPAHLVAHEQHGHAHGEERDGQEVADLARAQPLDLRVVARAIDAAVPAAVVIGTVAAALAVGLVALVRVADKVVQREAVVAGHEVDAAARCQAARAVEVGAAQDAQRHGLGEAGIALHEGAHVVAESSVPLAPALAGERADLVQATGVPRLGDELGAGELGVGLDVPDERRVRRSAGRPSHA